MRRLTLCEIKEKLKKEKPNIIILSNEYINSQTKLKCKCLTDGHEWETYWKSLNNSKVGCPICGLKALKENQKLTLGEIKKRVRNINPTIEILSGKYENANKKLKCKCLIDNHIWEVTWGKLSVGRGCPKCRDNKLSERFRLSIEEIQNRLNEENKNIRILSHKYKNSKSPLKCKCMIDGNVWITTWDSLSQNSGCPTCAIKRASGNNSCRWKGGISQLSCFLRSCLQKWKNASVLRCDYKCVITGKEFEVIHHLYGFDAIFQETLKITKIPLFEEVNKYTAEQLETLKRVCLELHFKYGLGVCLTKEIHIEFHRTYGYGNNTPEQFEEFKRMKEFSKTS